MSYKVQGFFQNLRVQYTGTFLLFSRVDIHYLLNKTNYTSLSQNILHHCCLHIKIESPASAALNEPLHICAFSVKMDLRLICGLISI